MIIYLLMFLAWEPQSPELDVIAKNLTIHNAMMSKSMKSIVALHNNTKTIAKQK